MPKAIDIHPCREIESVCLKTFTMQGYGKRKIVLPYPEIVSFKADLRRRSVALAPGGSRLKYKDIIGLPITYIA